jgi:hypothetical protein
MKNKLYKCPACSSVEGVYSVHAVLHSVNTKKVSKYDKTVTAQTPVKCVDCGYQCYYTNLTPVTRAAVNVKNLAKFLLHISEDGPAATFWDKGNAKHKAESKLLAIVYKHRSGCMQYVTENGTSYDTCRITDPRWIKEKLKDI